MLHILLFLISLCDKSAADRPHVRDSVRVLADSLIAHNNHREAAETLAQLTEGREAIDYVKMGNAYLAGGRRGKAKKAFMKAIDLGAEAEGYHGIGLVYRDMVAHGQLALINFRKALGKDPNFAESQYQIAQIYRTLRPLEAKTAYRATIKLNENHSDAYFQLGKLLEEEGRPVEAKAAYKKQIEQNPSHGFASLNLGRQIYGEGKKLLAARVFGALMEAGGEVETASYLEMALMSYDAQDFGNAERLFEAYIDRLPEGRRLAFTDIAHVASDEDLALLSSIPEVDHDEMCRRYWRRLDPSPLSESNERLVEHFRRVAYSINQFSKGEQPFDERGRVYVRFGRPDHVSTSDEVSGEVESYLVRARENFVSWMRLGVEVRPGLPTYPVGGDERWEYWVYAELGGGLEFTFTSRFSDGKYRYASIPKIGPLTSINEFLSMHGDNVSAEASRGESSHYIQDFATFPINFFYYPASFRGADGKTRLELYYGLPANDIARSKQRGGDDLIVFDRAIALYDSMWNEVYREIDQMTFRVPTDQQANEGAFIPGIVPVDLAPGDYWMSLQIRDRLSGKSQVYKQWIVLDDYAPRDELQISDIELAFYVGETLAEDGEFYKNGLKVIPMSSKAFQRDQNAFVYFELYNLARDSFGQSKYQIEYTVLSHTARSTPAKILRGLGRILRVVESDQEVKVSFEQTGDGETDIAYVELDIRESRPGGQMVKVKVTDLLTDVSAEKSIKFSVDGI